MRPMDDPDAALPFIRDILSTLRSNVGGQSTVLGFVGTPWTLAAYAIEGAAERHAPLPCDSASSSNYGTLECLHAGRRTLICLQ